LLFYFESQRADSFLLPFGLVILMKKLLWHDYIARAAASEYLFVRRCPVLAVLYGVHYLHLLEHNGVFEVRFDCGSVL
jgi:hypothetical protein